MKNKGFTIIESLLYGAIFVVFLLVLTQIFTASLDVQLESEAQSAIQQDGRFILSRLDFDILRADAITVPVAAGDVEDNLALTIDGNTYTYTLLNRNLLITDAAGSHNLNSFGTTVSNLTFKRLSNDTIQASFTLTSTTQRPGGADIRNFQSTFGTR
jgi:type II secretory pathway pseudopilin PulG